MAGQRHGEVVDARLGRGIGGAALQGADAVDRADIDDGASGGVVQHFFAIEQARPDGSAEKIENDNIQLILRSKLKDGFSSSGIHRAGAVAPGDIDHNVDASEVPHDIFGMGRNGISVTESTW